MEKHINVYNNWREYIGKIFGASAIEAPMENIFHWVEEKAYSLSLRESGRAG